MTLRTAALSLALFASTLPSVASAATVQILHGIDGRDIGAERNLPVDIAINGDCTLTGVTYTKSAQAELGAGEYEVTIHPSDGSCSQDALLSKDIEIPDNGVFTDSAVYSVVASLSGSGEPQIAVFDEWKTLQFQRQGAVRHLAAAGAVTVNFKELGKSKSKRSTARNGQTALFGDFWSIRQFSFSAKVSAGKKTLADVRATARGSEVIIYNIFGSAKNGFKIVRQRVVLSSKL